VDIRRHGAPFAIFEGCAAGVSLELEDSARLLRIT
jgi:hypothetical protein